MCVSSVLGNHRGGATLAPRAPAPQSDGACYGTRESDRLAEAANISGTEAAPAAMLWRRQLPALDHRGDRCGPADGRAPSWISPAQRDRAAHRGSRTDQADAHSGASDLREYTHRR
jgi:hypothetical protein